MTLDKHSGKPVWLKPNALKDGKHSHICFLHQSTSDVNNSKEILRNVKSEKHKTVTPYHTVSSNPVVSYKQYNASYQQGKNRSV